MSNRADPASGFSVVTPSDSASLATPSRALFVGTAGNIAVHGGQGQTVLFKNVAAGTILPVVATKVMSTNTTAADIVALF